MQFVNICFGFEV